MAPRTYSAQLLSTCWLNICTALAYDGGGDSEDSFVFAQASFQQMLCDNLVIRDQSKFHSGKNAVKYQNACVPLIYTKLFASDLQMT